MGRGLIVALLLASLAANVFLGGFVAGRLLGASQIEEARPDEIAGPPPRGGRGGPFPGDPSKLPPEVREVFRDAFIVNRAGLRSNRRAVLDARRDLAEILSADEWDRAAVEAAMARVRAAHDAEAAGQSKLMIDALEKLSVEERKALIASQFSEEPRRRRPFRRERSAPQ